MSTLHATAGAIHVALRLDALAQPFVLALAAVTAFAAFGLVRARQGVPALALGALALASAALAGAFTAVDLESLLFFWEASLVPLLVLVGASRPGATGAALRAFAACGVGDLALMAGFGLVAVAAGHDAAGELSALRLAPGALATGALVLVVAGAAARLAASPFHGWATDAAERASAPAAAFAIAAGKLAGGLLLARVVLPAFPAGGPGAAVLAVVGAVTLAGSLALALAQTDRARLVAHLSAAHSGAVLLAAALGGAAAVVALSIGGALLVAPAFLALRGERALPASLAGPARAARAAERALDPAVLGRGLLDVLAIALFAVDRAANAIGDLVVAGVARAGSAVLRRAHDGSHATYLVWSMLGFAAIVLYLVGGFSR